MKLSRGVAAAAMIVGLSVLTIVFFFGGLTQTEQAGQEKRTEHESNGSEEKPTASGTGDSEPIVDLGGAGTEPAPDSAAAERSLGRSGAGSQPAGQVARDVRANHWLQQPASSRCVSKRGWTTWPWQVFVQWRPDGREVLFSQGPELFAVTADGGPVRRVAQAWRPAAASPPPHLLAVDWGSPRSVGTMFPFDISPDGEQLMFATCTYPRPGSTPTPAGFVAADYEYELARVPVAGGEPARITRNLVFDGHPSWSPDGRRVAFVQGSEGRRLSTVAADGTDLRGIVEALEGFRIVRAAPAWSPDGGQLAFVGRPNYRPLGIYVVPSAGTSLLESQDLSPLVTRAVLPAWSPDGRRLAFARRDDDSVGLYTIAVDGTDERQLTVFADPRLELAPMIESLAWSPDGTKILLIVFPFYGQGDQPRAIPYVVDATSGGQVSIEPPLPRQEKRGIEWRPRAAAWAPDGTRIALLAELNALDLFNSYDTFPVWPVALLSVAPDGTDVLVLAQSRLGDDWYNDRKSDGYGPTMTANGPGVCGADGVIPDPAANPGLLHDCMVLLRIRHVLHGEYFLHWFSDVPVPAWTDLPLRPLAEWDGVEVSGSPPRVRGLTLAGLSGEIPPELARLTALVRLDLNSGYLEGPIPAELGDLARLEHLDLSDNRLTGPIPSELGQLANLTLLDLHRNALAGPIPEALGALPRLEQLNLNGNQLTGCIPADLQPTGDHDLGDLGLPRCETAA